MIAFGAQVDHRGNSLSAAHAHAALGHALVRSDHDTALAHRQQADQILTDIGAADPGQEVDPGRDAPVTKGPGRLAARPGLARHWTSWPGPPAPSSPS